MLITIYTSLYPMPPSNETIMSDPLEQFHLLNTLTNNCIECTTASKNIFDITSFLNNDILNIFKNFVVIFDLSYIPFISFILDNMITLFYLVSNNWMIEVVFVIVLYFSWIFLNSSKNLNFTHLKNNSNSLSGQIPWAKEDRFSKVFQRYTVQHTFFYKIQNIILNLIKSILNDNTPIKRKEYVAITHFLFIVIFTFNLIGLIPFTYTLTSNIVMTLFLASVHFFTINLLGFYKKGISFVDLFVPSGLPILLIPFLIIIELISYLSKVVSLSVRLFANMMSGHALLKILIGFSWALLSTLSLPNIFISLIPWVTVTLILFLEALIAFLQAYVFAILLTIYLSDVLNADH